MRLQSENRIGQHEFDGRTHQRSSYVSSWISVQNWAGIAQSAPRIGPCALSSMHQNGSLWGLPTPLHLARPKSPCTFEQARDKCLSDPHQRRLACIHFHCFPPPRFGPLLPRLCRPKTLPLVI
jgi:hypothetical protein